MKIVRCLLGVCAMAFFMACTDELIDSGFIPVTDESELGDLKFQAVIDQPQNLTRIEVETDSANGRKFLQWNPDDKVTISSYGSKLAGSIYKVFPDSSDKFTATFQIFKGQEEPQGYPYVALYPSEKVVGFDSAMLDDGRQHLGIRFKYESYRNDYYKSLAYTPDNIPENLFPMASMCNNLHTSNVEFHFRKLGSIAKLRLYHSEGMFRDIRINSVTLSADQPLNGQFVCFFRDTIPFAIGRTNVAGYQKHIKMSFPYGGVSLPCTPEDALELNFIIMPFDYTQDAAGEWHKDTVQYTNFKIQVDFEKGLRQTMKVARKLDFKSGHITPVTLDVNNKSSKFKANLGSLLTGKYACKKLVFCPSTMPDSTGLIVSDAASHSMITATVTPDSIVYLRTLADVFIHHDSFSRLTNLEHIENLDACDYGSFAVFRGMKKLKELKLHGHTFDMTGTGYCLADMQELKKLTFTNLRLPQVTTMEYTATRCAKMRCFCIDSLYAPKTTSMRSMCAGNSSLEKFVCKNSNLPLLSNNSSVFNGCANLKYVDFTNDNMPCKMSSNFFSGSSSTIEYVDVSGSTVYSLAPFCGQNVKRLVARGTTVLSSDMTKCFKDCKNLLTIDLKGTTITPSLMDYMFQNCAALTSLDLSIFNASECTSMSYMLNKCTSLRELNLKGFNTSACTNMNSMFANCTSLTSLDLKSLNTSACTNMSNMFSGCTSLKSVDLRGLDFSACTTMANMFEKCTNLTDLYLDKDFTPAKNCSNIFAYVGTSTDNGCTIHCPQEVKDAILKAKLIPNNSKIVWDVY
ncbi:MAG: BspA family leucine-rich repeat surface protein [Bacteroidaceae bacterium]|nr:BspA family leucine-rich repeat surface protein [Bacteroidaceae bacterium]